MISFVCSLRLPFPLPRPLWSFSMLTEYVPFAIYIILWIYIYGASCVLIVRCLLQTATIKITYMFFSLSPSPYWRCRLRAQRIKFNQKFFYFFAHRINEWNGRNKPSRFAWQPTHFHSVRGSLSLSLSHCRPLHASQRLSALWSIWAHKNSEFVS